MTATTEEMWRDDKAKGDEAFRQKRFDDAKQAYHRALASGGDASVLLNCSLTALRLRCFEDALDHARQAVETLERELSEANLGCEREVRTRLAKAHYREGSSLAALGRHGEAINAFRKGLKNKKRDPDLHRSLVDLSHHMKVDWLSSFFAQLIEAAEAPCLLSSRDGKVLKPPTDRCRLDARELRRNIRESLLGRESEFRAHICSAWRDARDPSRCLLAVVRCYAYLVQVKRLQEGTRLGAADVEQQSQCCLEQSARDAQCAVAYMPESSSVLSARARAAHSATLEHAGDWVNAAVQMMRACCLDSECEEYRVDSSRLLSKLTDEQRRIADTDGPDGLASWLEDEYEQCLPEYMRKRPKYYYYYEWMKSRIGEHFPQLPEAVMDKLLTTDADELDLLLQYPKAIKGQVEEYLKVLKDHGATYLETYETPRLDWEEVQAMNGGMGSIGDLDRGTDRALVAGGGLGQLTDVERRGEPAKPALAPDDERDQHHMLEQAMAQRRAIKDGRLGIEEQDVGRRDVVFAAAKDAAALAEPPGLHNTEEDLDGVD